MSDARFSQHNLNHNLNMSKEPTAEINLVIEFDDEQLANEAAAQAIQEQLGKVDLVKEAEAVVETPKHSRALSPDEIVAAIGVTLIVVKGGREIAEQVFNLAETVIKRFKGVKKVYLDRGDRRDVKKATVKSSASMRKAATKKRAA